MKHLLKADIFYVFKKTIEHIYRNMCLLICKFVVIAYISVQNILFYNKRWKWGKNLIFCCCLATKNIQSNYVNVFVTFAFMGQLCIQTTSRTTNITFQRCILHLSLALPPAKSVKNVNFRGHGLSQCCLQICIASDQVMIKTQYFKHE